MEIGMTFRYLKKVGIRILFFVSLLAAGFNSPGYSGNPDSFTEWLSAARNQAKEIIFRTENRNPAIEGRKIVDAAGDEPEYILFSKGRPKRNFSDSSFTIVSWNLENFGRSKPDSIINFIADLLNGFDIILIQEVVAGYGGAQAVAKLADELNRKGSKWDYGVSNPTSGENSYKRERYAFLWKTSRVNLSGHPWLEIKYTNEINREPFLATFRFGKKLFTLVNFHAITKKMQPETEIKYFKFFPGEYPDKNLIFCGDFNTPQSHSVFNPLKKMGYRPVFTGQKTSLKSKPINNDYLASEYDNIFYHHDKVRLVEAGVIFFYTRFASFKQARRVSDHIPVWARFSLN